MRDTAYTKWSSCKEEILLERTDTRGVMSDQDRAKDTQQDQENCDIEKRETKREILHHQMDFG